MERFRFQIKAVYPLLFFKIKNNSVYLFGSEEIYFKTKSAVSGPEFFDRNRITGGFGLPLNDNMQIEASYACDIMPRTVNDKVVNAFQLNFIYSNIFSKKEKPFKRAKTNVDDGSGGL